MAHSMETDYDVIILGGGLAGLCLARQLRMANERPRILILERTPHPVPEAAFKVGESSVELGAHYFAKTLKLEEHIHKSQLPKFGLRFFYNSPDNRFIDDGFEQGVAKRFTTPSYQLDRGRLENFMVNELASMNIEFCSGAKVTKVDLHETSGPHRIQFIHEGENREKTARWVVDACGRAAILRRQLNLELDSGHKVNAVWFRLNCKIQVDDWGSSEQWKQQQVGGHPQSRWLSTNHLMGEGYWVWLIPLASGATSVGIVADQRLHPLSELNRFDRALTWLKHHQHLCAAAIEKNRDLLMDFKVLKNFSHDCRQVFSPQRWALTGDAGVFLDPFYSPGSDFIAMSNTFITEIIQRDLARKPIGAQTHIYNQIYLNSYRQSLVVYLDQYPIFGNSHVMPVKTLWDYAVYWSLLAFFFIQGRLTDLSVYPRIKDGIKQVGLINQEMQVFFRNWHRHCRGPMARGFLDQGTISFLAKLNKNLAEELDADQFVERFHENLDLLAELAVEIREHAMKLAPRIPIPKLQQYGRTDFTPRLEEVFAVIEGSGQAVGL